MLTHALSIQSQVQEDLVNLHWIQNIQSTPESVHVRGPPDQGSSSSHTDLIISKPRSFLALPALFTSSITYFLTCTHRHAQLPKVKKSISHWVSQEEPLHTEAGQGVGRICMVHVHILMAHEHAIISASVESF